MKRLASIIAALALSLSMAFAPLAYATQAPYVIDNSGVLSSSEYKSLESKAEDMAEDYNIGVYLLFVDDIGSDSARSYAKNYYTNNNLGVGSLKAGILFLVAVDSRDYVTVTYGDAGGKTIPNAGGVDAFTDARIQNMEYDIIQHLKKNDWSGAAETYYDDAEETLDYLKENGEPMNNYRLDYSGSSSSSESEEDTLFNRLIGILAILGIPTAAAGSTVSREKRAMKTAREAQEAGNYLQRGSLKLNVSNDQFVNTTLAVAPIPRHEDNDDSGGAFGGGFGGFGGSSIDFGGFGGSDGGKF